MSVTDSATSPTGPIAYLTGEYPKVSHTFIEREIAALRAQGVKVLTCTVRRPPAATVVGAGQQAEASATFCIVETAKRAPHRLIGAHLAALLRSPRRWFSALGLAWRTRPPGTRALAWQLFYFLEAGLLADYLRKNGVVHLHNHFANSSCSVAMLASEISGIPFSFTLHGPSIFFEPKWWQIGEKIARAKFVACISHFARSQAMLFSNQSHWPKLKIVHCGVRPDTYCRRARHGSGKRIFFVGRLDAIKGVPLLLEAFAAALKNHPDARLDIIGDGPAREMLQNQARELGDAVAFLGYQPQEAVAEHLQEADIFVLPSFAEGVPVVIMEAMASRLPVIASHVAGVPELVEDGRTGFLVPPGDLETLAMRLETLLSDPALCSRMGETGRAIVEADFDVDREAGWIAALFAGQGEGLRPLHVREKGANHGG